MLEYAKRYFQLQNYWKYLLKFNYLFLQPLYMPLVIDIDPIALCMFVTITLTKTAHRSAIPVSLISLKFSI